MGDEIDRARRHVEAAMGEWRLAVDRQLEEFTAMIDELRRAAEQPHEWSRPEDWLTRRKRPRRRPRKPRGGEPAPVRPRPNPTPLVDGAEAPLE